jgi:hypothetical protein
LVVGQSLLTLPPVSGPREKTAWKLAGASSNKNWMYLKL